MNEQNQNLEKSKFEIENPDLFEKSMERTMPINPDPENLTKPGLYGVELKNIMEYINPNTVMLEVGGGGSSIYWTRYVKELVVVESSKTVCDRMKEILSKIPKKSDFTLHYTPPNFQQKKLSFPAEPGQFDDMINFIKSLENDKFDLVFIDGRDRVRSFEASIHSVKIGGILTIHDFWDRKRYHSLLKNEALVLLNTSKDFTERKNRLGVFQRIK